MANVDIFNAELGLVLDLTQEDLGQPQLPGLWEKLRADKRPVPERKLQCLECRRERPHAPEWMYLREHSDGTREAVHFNPSIGAHPAKGMSDEHKAYQERIATVGERAGLPVKVEDRATHGKRRTDVTIGPIGWEIQLSTITQATVVKRSQIARADGLTPSWMTSAKKLSELLRQAPWSLTNYTPWQRIREGRDIRVAGGVRSLEMLHCSRIPGPCPVKKRGKCNDWHGQWEVYNPTLDELVLGTAVGEFVPIIVPQSRWMNRWWVRPADRDLYAESVGGLPTEDDVRRGKAQANPSSLSGSDMERICRYGEAAAPYRSPRRFVPDQGQAIDASAVTLPGPAQPSESILAAPAVRPPTPHQCSAGVTPCGAPARLYACGWRCDEHSPAAMRAKNGGRR